MHYCCVEFVPVRVLHDLVVHWPSGCIFFCLCLSTAKVVKLNYKMLGGTSILHWVPGLALLEPLDEGAEAGSVGKGS
jgi:hypothetical protein